MLSILKMIVLSRYLRAVRSPTSKFSRSKEEHLPVKARLVRANNQWRMEKAPLIKVSFYMT
ncbi:hypothetical protein COL30_22305 [Bacillus pseudomycoides]|nr:hypothetical protein COO19_05665 [Bacillus pseudomycoides]PEI93118.1 hypothetical protein CN686_19190 [Bacillus pseudomycoides]PEM68742.1 hypothetical protein CN619_23050 [Bacillus pseudomycoides]PEO13949.1 hypothetical protein CN542_18710 [Bacillus pseudomycoides]PEP51626.1 hypothetical protein CN591_28560 [Bacillus pseudomycoides]